MTLPPKTSVLSLHIFYAYSCQWYSANLNKAILDIHILRFMQSWLYFTPKSWYCTPSFSLQSTYGVHVSKDRNTATYSVVLNKDGEVVVGIGDMEAHSKITTQLVRLPCCCYNLIWTPRPTKTWDWNKQTNGETSKYVCIRGATVEGLGGRYPCSFRGQSYSFPY